MKKPPEVIANVLKRDCQCRFYNYCFCCQCIGKLHESVLLSVQVLQLMLELSDSEVESVKMFRGYCYCLEAGGSVQVLQLVLLLSVHWEITRKCIFEWFCYQCIGNYTKVHI